VACKAQYYAMVGAFYFTKFGGAYVPFFFLFMSIMNKIQFFL
jgi:hypothetical protein